MQMMHSPRLAAAGSHPRKSAATGVVSCGSRHSHVTLQHSSTVVRGRSPLATHAYAAAPSNGSAAPSVALPPATPLRVFCDWAVYKGKGAMCSKIILPTWKPVGSTGTSVELERNGVLLLEFALPLPGSGYGSNQRRGYDWQQKLNFALSATELGAFLAGDGLEPDAKKPLQFVHDPGMGSASVGQVFKTLKILGNPDGTQMWSISQRTAGANNANINVNVSRAEFMVFKTLAAYAIPHMLGWDRIIDEGHAGFQMVAGSHAEDTYSF